MFHQSGIDGDGWDLCARCAMDPRAAEQRLATRTSNAVTNSADNGHIAEVPSTEVVNLVVGWLSADPGARITSPISGTGPRLLLTDLSPAKIDSLMATARESMEQMRLELATLMRNEATQAHA